MSCHGLNRFIYFFREFNNVIICNATLVETFQICPSSELPTDTICQPILLPIANRLILIASRFYYRLPADSFTD